jgi:hypothetical protein
VAAGLDTDALLGLTNPDLWRAQTLSGLRADPRLRDAFLLLDRLAPGPLHFGLRDAVFRWPALGESDRADLIAKVEACARAEEFGRAMAKQYTMGLVGCVAGVVVAVGVWVAGGLMFARLSALGWALVGIGGLAAGGLPGWLLSQTRDRRWVRDVLLPEADVAGVQPRWVLAVLEGASTTRGAEDKLDELRGIGPALQAELAARGGGREDGVAGFGPPRGHRPGGVRGRGPGDG